MTKGKNNGPKNQRTSEKAPQSPQNALVPAQPQSPTVSGLSVEDFRQVSQVGKHVGDLLAQCRASGAAAAIIPWFCDALPSAKSRKDYYSDMSAFFRAMDQQGIHPYEVTGDHVAMYKEALLEQGKKSASVARALSVLRGTYEQFGKKNLVPWERVGDIQGVQSPKVTKNTTPSLSEAEAIKLLHAPDQETIIGLRDHAILFTYFKTACRCAAIANAKIGNLERTDTDWFLVVTEKGKKERRQPLLEAAGAILQWVEKSGIGMNDASHPLFTPMANDRKTSKRRPMSQQSILDVVKKYARQAGIQVDRLGRRSVCTHTLRKTALNNALEHGAKVEDVQQWAGHADLRTTQEYIAYKEKGAEEAARRCQIR